jgi:hypothetical protein
MSIYQAAADAFCSQVHEKEIRERVHNLSRVHRDDVVLQTHQHCLQKPITAY